MARDDSDRDLGGEPACLMPSLDARGNVPDADAVDADAPAWSGGRDLVRRDPPPAAPEHAMLSAFLDYQRTTLLQKVAGLSDQDLRRRLVPSESTLLGMVKHLAYVERWWFAMVLVFAGDDLPVPWTDEDPDADFRVEPGESAADVPALCRAEVARTGLPWQDRSTRWRVGRTGRGPRAGSWCI